MADDKKTPTRLAFTRNFDFMQGSVMIFYPEGFVGSVKAAHAEAAIAKGAAREAKPGEKSTVADELTGETAASLSAGTETDTTS